MNRVLIVEDVAETRSWLAEIVRGAFPGSGLTEASSCARVSSRRRKKASTSR